MSAAKTKTDTAIAQSNGQSIDQSIDLSVELGRLRLSNPVLVASGTFGYAREMASMVDLKRLGGILPKTISAEPREGNAPWRTVETSSGMLNAIGLDNDGADAFVAHHMPYLASCGTPIIVSVAGRSTEEFVSLARRFSELDASLRPAAIELNLSCPNVSGGVDFGSDPALCETVVREAIGVSDLPILAKLTPNVTSIATMAKAAEAGGADAITLINTVLGMAIDWRKQKPMLANVVGGLSGPAIKPIALRCVWQAAQAVSTPIVGVGGIASIDDAMEFFVAGASAIQLGTVNFYRPTAAGELLDALPTALAELQAPSFRDVVGTLKTESKTQPKTK